MAGKIARFRRAKATAAASAGRRPAKDRTLSGKAGARRLVRLALATQPALLRDVLSRVLNREPDLRVVGEGGDEDEITKVLEKVTVDLVLLDYEALGPSSEGVIARLRRAAPRTRVLVLATRSSDEYVERVLRAGASGLVGKQLGFDTLRRAIRTVAVGEVWANPRTTALTLEHLTGLSARGSSLDGQLTRREVQIAECVNRGLRNKEIAHHLSISEKTVKSHLNNIFQKLGLEGRFALARFEQGLIRPKS